MWSAHQAEAPEATSTPAALPTAGPEGVDNTIQQPLLTPPNSPSNSSLDIYEEFEFYASSRLSHLEDGASVVVSDSASSGGTHRFGPSSDRADRPTPETGRDTIQTHRRSGSVGPSRPDIGQSKDHPKQEDVFPQQRINWRDRAL